MPSDLRIEQALSHLSRPKTAFLNALSATAEDVRRYLALQRSANDGADRWSKELGPFGDRYIDSVKWSGLFHTDTTVPIGVSDTVEKALATLSELERRADALFVARVEGDASLRDSVDNALANAGRAFGAANVVRTIQSRRYKLNEHARSLGAYPFARWSRAEREYAPPLLMEVPGDRIRAGALAEFLDGGQKIVLVVSGPATPAPLARLIGPSVFVQQAIEPNDLEDMGRFTGPAIAAVMPEGSAVFTYDPVRGATGEPALSLSLVPDTGPRKTVGGLSSAQQNDEIVQLESLAATMSAVHFADAAAVPAATDDPADKLAAWLLNRVDLEEVEPSS
jgi:hypothetical protein